jgi:hypothetical protein
MLVTKFCTHVKQQQNYSSVITHFRRVRKIAEIDY